MNAPLQPPADIDDGDIVFAHCNSIEHSVWSLRSTHPPHDNLGGAFLMSGAHAEAFMKAMATAINHGHLMNELRKAFAPDGPPADSGATIGHSMQLSPIYQP